MSFFIFFKDLLSRFTSSDTNAKNVFDHYFFDLKYYLNKDASVANFAHLLNIKPEKLDQIAFNNYACSCEILINEYRLKQFLEELESPINSSLSIESVLKFSGFENNDKFVDFVKSKQNSSQLISNSQNK